MVFSGTASAQTASAQNILYSPLPASNSLLQRVRNLPLWAGQMPVIVITRSNLPAVNPVVDDLHNTVGQYINPARYPRYQRLAKAFFENVKHGSTSALLLQGDDPADKVCLVTFGADINTSKAHMLSRLSGIPGHLFERIPGSLQEWQIAGLRHEAGHCASTVPKTHMFNFAGILAGEISADQHMLLSETIEKGPDAQLISLLLLKARSFSVINGPHGNKYYTPASVFHMNEAVIPDYQDGDYTIAQTKAMRARLFATVSSLVEDRALWEESFAKVAHDLSDNTLTKMYYGEEYLDTAKWFQGNKETIAQDFETLATRDFLARYANQPDFLYLVKSGAGELYAAPRDDLNVLGDLAYAARLNHATSTNAFEKRFLGIYIDAFREFFPSIYRASYAMVKPGAEQAIRASLK